MKSETGETETVWMATADVPVCKTLEASTEADVCVVGAGIAGLTTAYLLAKGGKKVVVLDDGPIASGQTRRTTAHLSNALDDRYHSLISVRGQEAARLAADVGERLVRQARGGEPRRDEHDRVGHDDSCGGQAPAPGLRGFVAPSFASPSVAYAPLPSPPTYVGRLDGTLPSARARAERMVFLI